MDLPDQGDVMHIKNWEKSNTIQELKATVESKGWTGFVLAKDGTCWFKNVPFKVTKEHCNQRKAVVVALHVLSRDRPTVQKVDYVWEFVQGNDLNEKGDVVHIPKWEQKSNLEELKRFVE